MVVRLGGNDCTEIELFVPKLIVPRLSENLLIWHGYYTAVTKYEIMSSRSKLSTF